MARRYKLITEEMFSKLLGSQPHQEEQIKSEQTHILTSKEIPDEIKPALYRDLSRQQQDFRKMEEAKPLLVETKNEPFNQKAVAEPKRQKTSKPPLKNLTKQLPKIVQYLE